MLKNCLLFACAALLAMGVGAKEIGKVLIIGNSIMKHGPAPQLGWNSDWGMAATAEEKDYAHLLHRKICDAVKQPKAPELQLARISNEKGMKGWEKLMNNNADVIVIQISDNYRGKKNAEEFQNNYSQMIKDLRGDRDPVIVCLTNWGGGPLNKMIQAAAAENNVLAVDLAPLAADPKNKAGSEGHFTNGGVNWHPGDRGMAAIADAAFAALEKPLKAKASE
ncbi:MAG: SGNH/GDSL hydrolase family protein [Lentisphaeria bacterium]|nr:SGNH/GDSL hydrolase family protein [Lentisphaeria bacterium]